MPLAFQYPKGWGVFDAGLFAVFDVDTMVDLRQSARTKVADFPIEDGGFVSYDKVREPFASKVRLAVSGADRVQQFLAALDEVVADFNLYSIVTPDRVYTPVTMEGYDYARGRERSATMVTVDLEFREIRQVAPAYATVAITPTQAKNPASASKQNVGKQQAQPPPTPFKDLSFQQLVDKVKAEG